MKKILWVLFLLVFIIGNAASASETNPIVFAVEQSKAVSVSLIEKADYVSFAVTVISRQKEPDNEFKEINEARELLISEAQKQEKIKIYNGPIYLSSTSNSKTSFSYGPSQATVHLLIPLNEVDWDVFKASSIITGFMDGFQPPGKAAYKLSPMKLAVDNPDRYRARLISMIYDDINQMKGLIKNTAKFFISGIANPVMVREFDYNHVELFINYTLSIEVTGE